MNQPNGPELYVRELDFSGSGLDEAYQGMPGVRPVVAESFAMVEPDTGAAPPV